jgi:hypothetical protein
VRLDHLLSGASQTSSLEPYVFEDVASSVNHWLLTASVRGTAARGVPVAGHRAGYSRGHDRADGPRDAVGTPCSSEGAFESLWLCAHLLASVRNHRCLASVGRDSIECTAVP